MSALESGEESEYRASLIIVDQDIYHFVVTNCLGYAATLSLQMHLLNPNSELSTLQYAEPFIAASATLLWFVLLLVLAYHLTLTSRYADCVSARARYKQHHVIKQVCDWSNHTPAHPPLLTEQYSAENSSVTCEACAASATDPLRVNDVSSILSASTRLQLAGC